MHTVGYAVIRSFSDLVGVYVVGGDRCGPPIDHLAQKAVSFHIKSQRPGAWSIDLVGGRQASSQDVVPERHRREGFPTLLPL